jgi:hypothetical protein
MMFNPGAAAHTPYGDGTVGRIEIVDGKAEVAFLHIDGKNKE